MGVGHAKARSHKDLAELLCCLRAEFPTPLAETVPAATGASTAPASTESGNLPSTVSALGGGIAGKTASGRAELGASKQRVYKDAQLPACANAPKVKLVLTFTYDDAGSEPAPGGEPSPSKNSWHVWLENADSKKISLPVGTFIGKGGLGAFVSTASRALSSAEQVKAWRFTRITSYKKDVPTKADGALVYVQSLTDPCVEPKLQTLEEIEKTTGGNVGLYAHGITRGGGNKISVTPASTSIHWVPTLPSDTDLDPPFGSGNVGQFIYSHESESTEGAADKGSEVHACLRPAFIVSLSAAPGAKGGEPSLAPSPAQNASPLCLYTCRKLELKPLELLALS